jgi:hypothetical protein
MSGKTTVDSTMSSVLARSPAASSTLSSCPGADSAYIPLCLRLAGTSAGNRSINDANACGMPESANRVGTANQTGPRDTRDASRNALAWTFAELKVDEVRRPEGLPPAQAASAGADQLVAARLGELGKYVLEPIDVAPYVLGADGVPGDAGGCRPRIGVAYANTAQPENRPARRRPCPSSNGPRIRWVRCCCGAGVDGSGG